MFCFSHTIDIVVLLTEGTVFYMLFNTVFRHHVIISNDTNQLY